MARFNTAPIHDKDHNSPAWVQWFRSVSNSVDSVGRAGVQTVANGATLTLTQAGVAVEITASSSDTIVVLPKALSGNIGEEVTVFIVDATFNGLVRPKTGETIVGDTEVVMNEDYMSLTFMVKALGVWVIV